MQVTGLAMISMHERHVNADSDASSDDLRATQMQKKTDEVETVAKLAVLANDALDSVDYKLVRAMSQAANEALFRKLDANQDGVLDRDELAEMAKAIGHESSAAEVDKLMKAADTNGDGEVDSFVLMPVEEAVQSLRAELYRWKPNSALVMLDFAMRRGYVSADDPEYIMVAHDLRSYSASSRSSVEALN